jgi:hypothetical protein
MAQIGKENHARLTGLLSVRTTTTNKSGIHHSHQLVIRQKLVSSAEFRA